MMADLLWADLDDPRLVYDAVAHTLVLADTDVCVAVEECAYYHSALNWARVLLLASDLAALALLGVHAWDIGPERGENLLRRLVDG
jgi:hypothetical protein